MVALQDNIPQQKPYADVVHGAPGLHLPGQHHGDFAVASIHQDQQGAMRQAQEGAVVHFTPRDLAGVALLDVRLRQAKGPFIHIGGLISQTQRPQPLSNEVLDFQVVRRGDFQLERLHQRLLVAELAILRGLAGFGGIEGFDGNPHLAKF